ncbi:MAG: phage tail tape measure protein [Lachnospiraceae bacterium]|nr:phage tail tape measure protein [Lachnospiraceae bacterium]
MASKTEYQLMVKLGATASPSWEKTLGKAEEALSGLNSFSNKMMVGISAGVTAAAITATAAISGAVEKYADFESEMATVQSISGAAAKQFSEMRDAALAAGSSTVFTATEAASALEYMSLAGWNADESISGLIPILELAAATGKELQTTSDLVTDSMSALGLEVADLDMYLDKLVQGNNKANNTAEQLMEGLVASGGAARALGADLDDTITALGVLANNGTKGAEAGTALNAILVRLAGNTTALKELDSLDVALWDDEGKFVGFEESLQRINNALSGLTDEDRTMSLKNIAGTHYYSQIAYLLEAVREVTDKSGNAVSAWQELETQVSNSSGALENMYDTTTDTLLFAQKRLDSAKEDMQIRVADVFADDAKDFLLWLSEKMPEATDSIVEFAEAHRGEFAEALEMVGEGIEMLWENGIAAGQWIIKHKNAILGGLKAVATGIVLIKTATTGIKIAQLFTNPLSAATVVAGLAFTAIGAVAGAIRDAETAAVNANLAAHFGNISLSMSEIEDVARRIVDSDYLSGVVKALEEFDELDSISDKMEDAVKALDKLNWKVSIGLELTEGEKEEYQRAIDDFVQNAQDYALQAQYSVSISMEFAFDEDDLEQGNLVTKVNQFYADKYQELSDLGTQLKDAVTDAFNDGLLEPDEITAIANIQSAMAEIEKSLAVGDYQAALSMLEMDYSGKELAPETLLSLMEELDQKSADAMESYRTAYGKNFSALTASYEGGYLTEEEYNSGLQGLKEELTREEAELQLQGMQFLLNTIQEAYGSEIEQYNKAVDDALGKWSDPAYDLRWSETPVVMWDGILEYIKENGPDKTTKKAITELLGPMDGSIEKTYALLEQRDILDPETRQALQETIAGIEQLQGMTNYNKIWGSGGDLQGLYGDVANRVADSDEYDNIKAYVDQNYEMLTGYAKFAAETSLMESMEAAKTEVVQPVVNDTYAYTQEYLDQVFSNGLQADTKFELTVIPDIVVNEMPAAGALKRKNGTRIMSNASGGIYYRPILTTFAEEGPEAAVPLDGSERARSIWAKAGQILGMFPQGNRDQAILAGMSGVQPESGTGRNIKLSYNPTVTIQGDASEKEVQKIQYVLAEHMEELREMIAEIERESRRTAFG